MDIYSEGGLIFLVMVDHLNGELLGGVIDSFYAAGAKNVQIISSITKKNRPSYIILIDGNENSAEKIENVIINECGSYGWHRISTDHRHTSVSIITKEIEVVLESGSFCFAAKASGADGANAARRTTKLVQKYFAFDPLVTVEVIEDGKRAYMEHFTDQVIPDVCFGKRDDVAWAVPVAAPAVSDLALSGCCILNIVVPASVAALMEYSSIADASEEVERAAYITGGIPGGKASAMKVAEEALAVYDIIK